MDFLFEDEDDDMGDNDVQVVEVIPPPLLPEDHEDHPAEVPPQPRPLQGGPFFELPERIHRRMGVNEQAVYENEIHHYLEGIMMGEDAFSLRRLQQVVDNAREFEANRRIQAVIERAVREGNDEERERLERQAQYMRLMELTRQAFREGDVPKRMPESPNLYTPKGGKFHWRIWDEANVMDWVKQFITDEDQLIMIQSREFKGPTLVKFLDSETDWKTAKWPFGLFIQLKSHMNRVINERNGHRYEIN
ncbi:unnamed protein product [Caenorhabditis brenneri]